MINKLEMELELIEKSPIEKFYENPCDGTLCKVPTHIQTPEMVEFAVANDGTAIKSVSKELITDDLCKVAVKQNGLALKYIPKFFISKEVIRLAVENNGTAISLVQKKNITKTLAKIAVCQHIKLKSYVNYHYPISYIPDRFIDKQLVNNSISYSPCSLKDIPYRYITKELLFLAVSGEGAALEYVPGNRISKQLINAAVCNNPFSLEFVPESRCTKEICDIAFNRNPFVIKFIPEKYITLDMCLAVIKASCGEDIDEIFEWFPDKVRNDKTVIDTLINKIGAEQIIEWNNRSLQTIEERGESKPLSEDIIQYLQSIIVTSKVFSASNLQIVKVDIPPPSSEAVLVNSEDNKATTYDLAHTDNTSIRTVYYITDLHLEYQLNEILGSNSVDYETINSFLDDKIREMLSSIQNPHGYLLIGGDVAHTKKLASLFYQKISMLWNGTIISVLGNHELWDNHINDIHKDCLSRPIDDIVNEYSNFINCKQFSVINGKSIKCKSILLQNAIYINYKNIQDRVIEENQIINASDNDLRDICSKSSLILLGGIGFSGLNKHYNAELGLYHSSITTLEEDRALSNQFKIVYDKLIRCAGDKQVIVLTHTPVYDWTNEPCNPNWVYINGHTHQNSLIRKQDGTTVLSDNQVGYRPSKWKLNGLTISGWYDPFKNMEDGIYEIDSELYKDFNLGRGIQSNGCNYPGKIYALKRNSLYMFVLQSKSSLCLLEGGRRKQLNHDNILYYYNNMNLYAQKVREALSPYQQALKEISKEIMRIGGWGTVHGCIVDINHFNHVYLNPFDGKVTPYWAWDTSSRLEYYDLPSLLKDHVPELSDSFLTAYKNNQIPLLSQFAVEQKKKTEKMMLATIPELVLDTEMYEPSRIMRSIQYIFDDNVIRIWKDEILTADFNNQLSITETI